MNSFFNTPEFKQLSPGKAAMLREMITTMDVTQDSSAKLQVLIAYSFKMKNAGQALSPSESNMLIQALQSNMTPEERNKVQTMLSMFR